MFLDVDFDLGDCGQNGPFVHTDSINNEVVNKSRNSRALEDKEKVQ